MVGAVAGALVTFSVEWFELKLHVDDPGGAISAHALGGLWGVLAVGLFGTAGITGLANHGQLLAQFVGIGTLLGFVFPLTYGLNWMLDRSIVSECSRKASAKEWTFLSWVAALILNL